MHTGVLTYADGRIFRGHFINNTLNGPADMLFATGDRYQGNTVESKFMGRGSYTTLYGLVYEGNWVNSKKCGHGWCFAFVVGLVVFCVALSWRFLSCRCHVISLFL